MNGQAATYTARFYDYYGVEFNELTRTENSFKNIKDYFNTTCENKAIPFAQISRNNHAISATTGRAIGANCDSRVY